MVFVLKLRGLSVRTAFLCGLSFILTFSFFSLSAILLLYENQ